MIDLEMLKRIILEKPIRRGSFRREGSLPNVNRIYAIIGPRRAGKTYFLFQLIDNLKAEGIDESRILYLNFEDERLSNVQTEDLDRILEAYFTLYPENKKEKVYLMFDEIQNAPGWQKFVRRIHDKENAGIYLTGSSAKLLSKEIATELRGRAFTHTILPFSFREFLSAKGIELKKTSAYGSERFVIKKQSEEFVQKGGFPETIGKDDYLRCSILQDYFETVLFRDIIERHGLGNPDIVKDLFRILVNNFARPFSVNKAHNQLRSMNRKVSKDGIYALISHIEDSMYFFFVPIHSASSAVRMVNPRKAYLVDTGLAGCLLPSAKIESGWLYENVVATELIRRGHELSYFKDRCECDFVAFERMKKTYAAIQVTLEPDNEREIAGLMEAMDALDLHEGIIITENEERTRKIAGKTIKIIPLWKWLIQ